MGYLDEATARLGGKNGHAGGIVSIQKLISSSGGLRGLTSRLSSSGLSRQVQSWIGTGQNEPVSGAQVCQAMDADDLHQVAEQASMSDQEASEHLAHALPEMVSKATPQGQLPENDPFAMGPDAVERMLKM